jgi:hypothetical protein
VTRRNQDFHTIRSEGGLLPPDLLRRVLDPRAKLDGTRPEDYGLPQSERLNEVITQSWNRLRKHWAEFRAAAASLPEGEAGTGLTNDKWSLPLIRELGFGLLPTSAGPEAGGRSYAISRFFGPVPVHLLGCGLSLDRRAAGQRGAAAANPHGLVQEFLNRSPEHVWAIVSNGLRLRVLRDNQALSRQSFLEFDLEAMFAGEVYSDFVLLWLMVHATRFAPREGGRPATCWLEQWTKDAEQQGTRALGDLRGGVERALQILGQGFTSHPKNTALRDTLRTGQVPLADFHGQLLRVVYRLIFLFVAEDRTLDGQPLLHPRDDSDAARTARERYTTHYSTTRVRELAGTIRGSRHGDLWRQFQLLAHALSGDAAFVAVRERLALPALGSFLWSPASTAALNDAELTNNDLLEVLRHLAFTRQGKMLRPVDYRNLGAEELGGVYESLLALTPQISADGDRFTFAEFAGNERKTSGSYYTPASLVQCLLDSALDPVVEHAIQGKSGAEAEHAVLSLKVCDPAVGSGHFLVGAAHRLARHLARVRALAEGESEPSPLLYQQALRNVIGRCLYGVDMNPMAAELCRVSLWLEALEPGKPLSFLDHHIRVGNSLLGAIPQLIAGGLPDEALNPIAGDDKRACAVLKQRNNGARKGWGPLFGRQEAETQTRLEQAAAALEELPDDAPEDIRSKELAFRRHEQTDEYRHKRRLADAWCAAFVIRKHFREPGLEASVTGITQGHLNDLAANRPLPSELAAEVERLSKRHSFFHWHLAFPEVFRQGGFDCVLGNPPWEKLQTEELHFFASRSPQIASLSGAKRKRAITSLEAADPALAAEWHEQRRVDGSTIMFVRSSGAYPLTAVGKFNTFALFAELKSRLITATGRVGCIVPSGIATDDTTKLFFQHQAASRSLVSLFDFENRNGIFPGVHRSYKFCLLTLTGRDRPLSEGADFVFFACSVEDLRDSEKRFTLSSADIALLNPNTLTCATFRTRSDAELTKAIHRRVPVFLYEANPARSPYRPDVWRLLNTTDDSGGFVSADGKRAHQLVPVIEAKTIHQFDHRFATFTARANDHADVDEISAVDKVSSTVTSRARYFVTDTVFRDRMPSKLSDKGWFLTARNIARSTDERTVIAAVIPRGASCEVTPYIEVKGDARVSAFLLGLLNSFVLDYAARQKVGGTHLSYYILYQLPVLFPSTEMYLDLTFFISRVLELTYTAWDVAPFAKDCGWFGPPFRWDDERRPLLRCELDAAFFHLYLPADANGDWREAEGETAEDLARLKASFARPRNAVAYIMDTFPIARRKDEEKYGGDYRTKRVIVEIYDAMQKSIGTGQHYQTRLNPPPGPPASKLPDWARGTPRPEAWPSHIHPLKAHES